MIFIDLLILVVLGLYGYFGYRRGLISGLAELVGFLLALGVAFAASHALGGLIFGLVHIPRGVADLVSFMLLWTVVELAFSVGWRYAQPRLVPPHLTDARGNRFGGIAPALVKGVILVTFLLLVVAVSPIPAAAKQPFVDSTLGRVFLGAGTAFQQQFNNVFGRAFRDTLAFRTIKTGSEESSSLGFTDADPSICAKDESRMLELVNQERRKAGLGALVPDEQLRQAGRAHSKDMLARGYFAHNSPDGLDPFDRMDRAEIKYQVAGENLAFAPTVDIAHTGLMNSPGHRANILKPDFTKLGVGCMDAGFRGKMFSQEFKG